LAEATPLTATGQILGTVYYTSPEQVTGDVIDGRSDLYSLGVVGFFALTGTFPFDADLASAVLIAHVNKPAPAVQTMTPGVPDALAAVVDRCLAKNPAQRYASARDVRLALEAAMNPSSQTTLGKPMLVSDTEAQAVWRRAAELQGATGVHGRPVTLQKIRDADLDKARTSGLRVGEIREAGREAGIRTEFLDHALAERGLVRARNTTIEPPRSWWAGVPLEVVRETELSTELDPKHFDRLRNILRLATGDVGTTSAYKREFAWQSSSLGNSLSVSIVPADGKTSVRLAQNARRMATTTMMSALAGGALVVGPLVTLLARAIIDMPTPPLLRALGLTFHVTRPVAEQLAIVCGAVAAVAVLPLARVAIQWAHRRLRRRADALLEAVVSNADARRES
jgi:serine/threonine-protein kinase